MGAMTVTHSVTDYALQQCSSPGDSFTLEARELQQNGQDYYAYNGTVPGPVLRVKQGDCLSITLVNHLPVATTIHWHGINLPNAEDGVPGVTQDSVKPGASFTYHFIVKDAGSYWYHSHNDTLNQQSRGLYGPLIVEPTAGTGDDHDYFVTYQPGNMVNGTAGDFALAAKAGEKVRLRLLNADGGGSVGDPLNVALLGASFRIVAKDGTDLHGPQEISNQAITIGPAERYDLEFTMPRSGIVRMIDLQHPETVSIGTGIAPATPALQPFDLFSYGTPAADPIADRTSFDASYDLHLGNHVAFYNGNPAKVHTINDQAAPDMPMITVKEGQVVRLRFINDTDEYHTMHLHGHHFAILTVNGKKPSGSPIYDDTVNVTPHSTVEVAFLANNPGLWMAHCHVLYHAYSGMMFMIDYEGVGTPFKAGVDYQNIPE
jgi:FtsP/CotA-like multicopper oxidase with cupredoxin domain